MATISAIPDPVGGDLTPEVNEEQDEMDEDEDEEIEDEEEVEDDEDEDGDICAGGGAKGGKKPSRGLTLQTLLEEKILEPGQGNMTINYLGNRFRGDLLDDGKIKSQETGKIFGTPSAWAIFCKKIVNPDKKSGCGWASVRYRGKKLDVYKNNWFRQKRLEFEKDTEMDGSGDDSIASIPEIVEYDALAMKGTASSHDTGTMVELSTFQSMGRMQPFNITMSSSAMAVIDVHAHVSVSEVCGYLAGQWDVNNHNLIVSHAFPVRCRLGDQDKGPPVEQELYDEMARLKLSLVGWYHSHAHNPPLPSLRDVDTQLEYQMKMKGYNDASYTPVLGIIVAPYQKSPIYTRGLAHRIGNATGYWVLPPTEAKPMEYGRPMSMQFTLVQDAFIPKEALLHMSEVLKFYKGSPDAVVFAETFEDKVCNWHKLKTSLHGRVPKDHFQPLIDFLTKLIDEKLPEDLLMPPQSLSPSQPTTSEQSAIDAHTFAMIRSSIPDDNRLSPRVRDPNVLDTSATLGKDLESCVSNIIKSSISSLNFDSLYTPAESYFKDKTSTTSLRDHPNDDHHRSTTPKSSDGKTTPPKTYSPLFNLPPPPLFTMESKSSPAKDLSKDPFKDLYPHPMSRLYSESSKSSQGGSSIGSSSASDTFQSTSSSKNNPKAPPPAYVNPLLLNAAALMADPMDSSKSKRDQEVTSQNLSSYLSMAFAAKESQGDSGGRNSAVSKMEEALNLYAGSQMKADKPAASKKSWLSHAKMLQEAFALPPHERDNPFVRDPQAALQRELLQDALLKESSEGVRELFKDASHSKDTESDPMAKANKDLGMASGTSPITNAPLFSHWNPALMFDRDASGGMSLKTGFPPPPPYPLHSLDAAKTTSTFIQAQASLPPTGFSFSLEAPSKTKDGEKRPSDKELKMGERSQGSKGLTVKSLPLLKDDIPSDVRLGGLSGLDFSNKSRPQNEYATISLVQNPQNGKGVSDSGVEAMQVGENAHGSGADNAPPPMYDDPQMRSSERPLPRTITDEGSREMDYA